MGNFGLVLLQLGVILGFLRLIAAVFRRIGQPQVVGEMVAGFVLGPTVFGALAPHAFRVVFPPESLATWTTFAQTGMAVFLFLAGMRVDFAELRPQSRVATAAGIGSMVLPFVAGFILSQRLYSRYSRGNPWDFSLFLAVAMSVTAFPVLARILSERNLLETPLGATAIAGAAFDDVVVWILLAVIFGSSGQTGSRDIWLGLLVFAALVAALRASSLWRPAEDDPVGPAPLCAA